MIPAFVPEDRHCCPWPGCTRRVPRIHWGCLQHFDMLPTLLRTKLRKEFDSDAGVQGDGYNHALSEIRAWIQTHGRVSELADGFSVGVTADASMRLLWVKDGTAQYLDLTKAEVTLIIRSARALFAAAVPPVK